MLHGKTALVASRIWRLSTGVAIKTTLEKAGVQFLDPGDPAKGPGVTLKTNRVEESVLRRLPPQTPRARLMALVPGIISARLMEGTFDESENFTVVSH